MGCYYLDGRVPEPFHITGDQVIAAVACSCHSCHTVLEIWCIQVERCRENFTVNIRNLEHGEERANCFSGPGASELFVEQVIKGRDGMS